MNVLIVSNSSYIDTVALLSLEYLLNRCDNYYFLLSENHDCIEKEIINNTRVRVYGNIIEAIRDCDITLLYSTERSSKKKENRIEGLCAQYNKSFYRIVFPENIAQTKQLEDLGAARFPSILTISIGTYNYQHRTEVIINEIFKRENMGIRQTFSNLSFMLLDQYNKVSEIDIAQMTNSPIVQVVAQSYLTFNDLVLDSRLYNQLALIKPSVIIVDVEASFSLVQELSNLFKYKFGCEIDLCIRSNYAQISSGAKGIYKPIYYPTNEEFMTNNKYIEYSDAYMNIYHTVMSKLAFPQGIKYINAL